MNRTSERALTEKVLSSGDQNIKVSNNESENKEALNTKRPFVVSIEGNIGSGKSTMINYFKNR